MSGTPRLNAATLPAIGERVPVPAYARAGLTHGIVHIGVGGFHRAHEAVYVDDLIARGLGEGWAISGVGLLPGDRRMAEVLTAQDGLYTVVLKESDGSLRPRVVGSIVEYLLADDDPEAVVERLADPRTRIVSLTITEGGYAIAPDGGFDPDAPGIAEDLVPGASPRTVFGYVVEALARRRDRGILPFTVLSCDNIQHNGDVARTAFVGFARLRGAELGDWVAREVAFPNSMVDRIAPVTQDSDIAALEAQFGYRDAWPAVCEPFTQWVVEDAFGPLGRPAFEQVGAQLVDDVAAFEMMKLRLLNASHQAMSYLGVLTGYSRVDETMRDEVFERFLRAYMEREALPTLRPVPGVDLTTYICTLLERFANPGVSDTLARNCVDTSQRIPTFLLPVVRDQLASDDGRVDLASLVVASWRQYARGLDERGDPIDVVDVLRDDVVSAAQDDDPVRFLRLSLFGDLADQARFVDAYTRALALLREHGARAAMLEILDAA